MVKKNHRGQRRQRGATGTGERQTRETGARCTERNLVAGRYQSAAFCGRNGNRIYSHQVDDGTTIAEDNKEAFKVIDDPFGSGKKIGLLKR